MAAQSSEEDALRTLAVLRVAKDLYLSDWYASSAELLFEGRARVLLSEVADETAREKERLFDISRRWASELADSGDADATTRQVLRFSRMEFLLSMIESKDRSGEALEKCALVAPQPLRDEILAVAAVDFRHATELRDILSREIGTRG